MSLLLHKGAHTTLVTYLNIYYDYGLQTLNLLTIDLKLYLKKFIWGI